MSTPFTKSGKSATSDSTTALEDATAKSAFRKATFRLVPFVAILFFINYLDRTVISTAGPHGMNDDLALSSARFGFASGVFFIGYVLLEVPSNLGLHRFGARRWLSRIMVTWGIVAVLFTWVQNFEQLALLRFLLGVAEAGFTPGAVLFFTMWFPRHYRTRALGFFYLAQPVTGIFGPPLASLLIEHGHGILGLEGWRFMYLVVGLPAIIFGIVCWFYLTDRPAAARWLNDDEKAWFDRELEADNAQRRDAGLDRGVARVFRTPKVFAIAAAYFGLNYGYYAMTFFLPTIVAGFQAQFNTHFSVVQQGLITACVNVPAALALLFWSRFSARRGFRPWHVAVPLLIAGISIPIALYMPSPLTTIIVVAITACGLTSTLSLFWSLPTTFLTGASAAAGFALINSIANLGGFSAPYITGWLEDGTGTYKTGLWLTGAILVAACTIILLLRLPGTSSGDQRRVAPKKKTRTPRIDTREPSTGVSPRAADQS